MNKNRMKKERLMKLCRIPLSNCENGGTITGKEAQRGTLWCVFLFRTKGKCKGDKRMWRQGILTVILAAMCLMILVILFIMEIHRIRRFNH